MVERDDYGRVLTRIPPKKGQVISQSLVGDTYVTSLDRDIYVLPGSLETPMLQASLETPVSSMYTRVGDECGLGETPLSQASSSRYFC